MAQGLAKLCQLGTPDTWDNSYKKWSAAHVEAVNSVYIGFSALRDGYRLVSSAASASERNRVELVMEDIHPQFTLPAVCKAQTRKLVSEKLCVEA